MPNPLLKLLGGLLMALGGLIAGLCGLCTGGFILFGLFSGGGMATAVTLPLAALMIGTIPIAIGIVLILAGRAIWRTSSRP